MYDFIDRPIGVLDEGDRFLVWAMRGWTQSMAERRCPPSVLATAFDRSQLSDALPHFHLGMSVLNRDGKERMGFGAICCPQVSEAEAVILALMRLIGRGEMPAASATIALLVAPEAEQKFTRALTAVAILLFARYPLPDGVDGQ